MHKKVKAIQKHTDNVSVQEGCVGIFSWQLNFIFQFVSFFFRLQLVCSIINGNELLQIHNGIHMKPATMQHLSNL